MQPQQSRLARPRRRLALLRGSRAGARPREMARPRPGPRRRDRVSPDGKQGLPLDDQTSQNDMGRARLDCSPRQPEARATIAALGSGWPDRPP
eukprot:15441405-Alexandrium_andersonii.AAC.2